MGSSEVRERKTVQGKKSKNDNNNQRSSKKNNSASSTNRAESGSSFHWDLWLVMALNNWIFDFGRPIAAMWVPLSWSPLDLPSIGDYFHMAYNVITPFCILKLMDRSKQRVSTTVSYLCVIVLVMGASIHLVGDSVNHRLIHLGYKNHLAVRENPIMQHLKPQGLIKSFELLYVYDEVIGHLMWYLPMFFSFFLFYMGSFTTSSAKRAFSASWLFLVLLSGASYWYIVVEGQIFPLFLATFTTMLAVFLWKSGQGLTCNINGLFLLWTFAVTLALAVVWSLWLWNDVTLRQKYQGWLYMPEPWAYYTLYLA